MSPSSRPDNSSNSFIATLSRVFRVRNFDGPLFMVYGPNSEMASYMKQYDPVDKRIYLIVMLLSAFGAVIQYSASCSMCANGKLYNYDPANIFKKQVFFACLCIVIMLVLQYINYQILDSWLAHGAYISSIAAILLLKTSLGVNVNGATRWIRLPIGGFTFAPSEFCKVCLVIELAYIVYTKSKALNQWYILFWMWGLGAIQAGMLYKIANDLSSAIVILMLTFFITMVTTRCPLLHTLAIVGAVIFLILYVRSIATNMPTNAQVMDPAYPFRNVRIAVWLDPAAYQSTKGWQTYNTLSAVGAGGLFGRGLGAFQRIANLIPEAYTDVIFGVIVYELGVVGAAAFLFLYALLARHIHKVCVYAEDLFGSVLVMGYMGHIIIQVVLHCAVVLNIMPNTGQVLPWISYSGTAFGCLGIEIGLILSVYRHHLSHYARLETAVKKRK